MLSLTELCQKKVSSIDKVEKFRLQQQTMLEQGQRWFLLPALLIAVGAGLFFLGKAALGAVFFGLSVVVFLLVGAFKILPAYTKFNDQFKRQVLYAFLEDIYPSVYYAPDNYVPSSLFAKAQLYPVSSHYTGKDYVEGEIKEGGTFKFSALNVNPSSTNASESNTPFKGLFLVIDVHQHCDCSVYVLPATAAAPQVELELFNQQSLEDFLAPSQDHSYPEDYLAFAKDFVVYSKDKKAAESFLQVPLIEALYHWYSEWNCTAHLSLIGQQLFVALPLEAAFPIPDFVQKATNNADLKRFYDQLLYCLSLVEYYGSAIAEHNKTASSSPLHLGNDNVLPLAKEKKTAPESKNKNLPYKKN